MNFLFYQAPYYVWQTSVPNTAGTVKILAVNETNGVRHSLKWRHRWLQEAMPVARLQNLHVRRRLLPMMKDHENRIKPVLSVSASTMNKWLREVGLDIPTKQEAMTAKRMHMAEVEARRVRPDRARARARARARVRVQPRGCA